MNLSKLPCVAAIIIHWNQEKLTHDTIESLLQTGYQNLSIILVDNGSTDGSGERIAEEYPNIRLVLSEENLGYAGGANLGFVAALITDAKYHFLLNNDVVFDSGIIDALVAVMEGEDGARIGLCVPKIFFFDEPQKIWYAGGDVDSLTGLCNHRGYGRADGPEYAAQLDCSFANGCAMFIRREVLTNVGLFDTSYFHTGEDVDYSLRLKAQEYRIVFVPQARLWHKIRSSAGGEKKATYLYNYYEHRNRILIMRKYFRKNLSLKSYAILAKFYLRSALNEIKVGNTGGVKGILHGLYDGFNGISGQRG